MDDKKRTTIISQLVFRSNQTGRSHPRRVLQVQLPLTASPVWASEDREFQRGRIVRSAGYIVLRHRIVDFVNNSTSAAGAKATTLGKASSEVGRNSRHQVSEKHKWSL